MEFVNSQETVNPIWSEVKRVLPRIADEFFKVSKDELSLFDQSVYPCEHMQTKHRDIPIKTIGPISDIPFVSKSALHGTRSPGYGAIHYKCRISHDNPGRSQLAYAVIYIKGTWSDDKFLVCKKNEAARVILACQKQCRLALEENQPPILEEGVLDSIVANTVGFLINSKEIAKFGVRLKRGLILDGHPGNGKSMVCRYLQRLCSQNSINFGIVTAADIDKAYREQYLTKLFHTYDVTFFDDIDISYMNRRSGDGKMATSLLTAMDGMHNDNHLIRIFTTNEPLSALDPAFTRPGRIDKCITLPKPNEKLRRQLVSIWPNEILDAIDTESLVTRSNGYSFAELESIRTILVTNKILGCGKWDLDQAFRDHESRSSQSERHLGFAEE